jgi:hypothetical protein
MQITNLKEVAHLRNETTQSYMHRLSHAEMYKHEKENQLESGCFGKSQNNFFGGI